MVWQSAQVTAKAATWKSGSPWQATQSAGVPRKTRVHVARRARHRRVLAGEREGGLAVVEAGVTPVAGVVARGAVLAELAIVRVVLGMAGVAVRGRSL